MKTFNRLHASGIGPRGGVERELSAVMANSDVNQANPLSYLPHQGREYIGHAPEDAASPEIAEQNADKAIHQIMAAQKREVSRQNLPHLEPEPHKSPAKGQTIAAKLKTKLTLPHNSKSSTHDTVKRGASFLARLGITGRRRKSATGRNGILQRIMQFRPSRKMSVLAIVALIVFWRPLLLPAVVILSFLSLLIAYFTLGPDRVAELVAKAWHRLAARKPALAETIRHKADAVALRIDAFLDFLPGDWADRISLPDFASTSKADQAEEEGPDPFDRLGAQPKAE